METQVLRYHETGDPETVLRLERLPLTSPGQEEVLVRVLAASINPADINMLEGKYGKRPTLPAVAGMEGVGVIESAGAAVAGLAPGDTVLLPPGVGAWREKMVVDAADLLLLPRDIDPIQAAMLRVNPPTAWLMLNQFVDLAPGDWVIQNAANSAVGRCVIQIAKSRGLRTLNVVRRPELVAELEAAGADEVLLDTREAFGTIPERTGGAAVRLALNAVGGDASVGLAAALAPGGVLVTYGAMAKQPVKLPAGLLIFRDIVARGFWLTRWFEESAPAERIRVFKVLVDLVRSGKLHVPVERTYGIAEFAAAIRHAMRSHRTGKIVFAFAG